MAGKRDRLVRFQVEAGIARLVLDRPPVNVLDLEALCQLETALQQMAADGNVQVLVLAAAGKMFSAGVNVADHTVERVGQMIPLFNRVCQALADFPVPTIAAVHGHALGGGCELVICCDLAVMAEGAKIGQPEIKLAAIAPVAALRLPLLVGYRAAADLMFTGRNLTAHEALAIGLVNAVVPTETTIHQWAEEKAAGLAGLSRAALTLLKQALRLGFDDWHKRLPEIEHLYLEKLMSTEDAQEGLLAFMEKRTPIWRHK